MRKIGRKCFECQRSIKGTGVSRNGVILHKKCDTPEVRKKLEKKLFGRPNVVNLSDK